jgi:hypothetical protein
VLRFGTGNTFDLPDHFKVQLDRDRVPSDGTELLTVLGRERLLNEARKLPELDPLFATWHDFADCLPYRIGLSGNWRDSH